jgi:MFS family permease
MQQSIFLRFILGRFLAALGDQFLLFAVPLLVYKTTGSVSLSGLTFFIEWAPRVLFLPLAGVLTDRFGGPGVYLTSDVARSLACILAFVLLTSIPGSTFLALSVLVGIVSVLNAQAFVALEVSLPRYAKPEQLPRAQALLQGSEQLSQILGPALAALCALTLPKEHLLLVAAVAFAISFINVLWLRRGLGGVPTRAGQRPEPLLKALRMGWSILWDRPLIFALIGLTTLVNLMIGVTLACSAALTTGVFSMPDSYFGALYTLGGVVAVASFLMLPLLMRRFSLARLGVSAYALMCLSTLGIGLATTYAQFAVGLALLLGSVGIFNVFIRTERVRLIPSEHLGKTMGLVVLLNQLSLPFSGLLVAALAGRLGPQRVILGVGLTAILAAAFLLPFILLQVKRYSHEAADHP